MSEKFVSLSDCIKELLGSGADKVSHVTFFVERQGMVRISFNDFVKFTDDIRINSRVIGDHQRLLTIFGDNFCFVYNDGYVTYIYAVVKNTEDYYGMVSIDPVGANSRWDSYSDEYKRVVIRKFLHL